MEFDRGYAVVCRMSGDGDIYVLIQKVVTPPAKRHLWFFPGGAFVSPADAGQRWKQGVMRVFGEMSGSGRPAGLPPLEDVSQLPVRSNSRGNNRVFQIFFLRAGVDGGAWDGWEPCPHASKIAAFEQPDQPLSLNGHAQTVRNGHCWARWSDLMNEAAAWSPERMRGSPLHNQLIEWFNRNGESRLKHVLGKARGGVSNTQSHGSGSVFQGGGGEVGLLSGQGNNRNITTHPRVHNGGGRVGGGGVVPLCKFFQNGNCKHGSSCKFRHEKAVGAAPMAIGSAGASGGAGDVAGFGRGSGLGSGNGKKLCRYFRSGSCKNGDSCPFSHCVPHSEPSKPSNPTSSTQANATAAFATSATRPDAKQVTSDFLSMFYATLGSDPTKLAALYTSNARWHHQNVEPAEGINAVSRRLAQDTARLRSMATSKGVHADSSLSFGGESILIQAVCLHTDAATQVKTPFAHSFLLVRTGASWSIQNESMNYM